MPPAKAAFTIITRVEALWKQEDAKRFVSLCRLYRAIAGALASGCFKILFRDSDTVAISVDFDDFP